MKGFLLLVIGFILGFSTGISADSGASLSKPNQEFYKSPSCRGNGDAGYRACRINVPGPYEKLAINAYVDGEFEFGLVWKPFEEDFKVVKR